MLTRKDRGQIAVEVEAARLTRDVVSAITFYMDEHNVSRAALARSVGLSPSRVSQILSGDENLTLRTVATVAAALEAKFEIDLIDADTDESASAVAPSFADASR